MNSELYRITPSTYSGYESYLICEELTLGEKKIIGKIVSDYSELVVTAIKRHKTRPDFEELVINKIKDAIKKPIRFTTIRKDFVY